MLFYDSIGPNPRVVRMFMAERGIEVPKTTIDLLGGENRQAAYLAKNPAATMPCLELDDGSILAEITAICEYLDEISPGAPLMGSTPQERAEIRMWTRRIDLGIAEPVCNGFRFAEGLKMFQNRIRCMPEAAAGLKAAAQDKIGWLNGQMEGKTFVCRDRLTLADILLFCNLDFGAEYGQPLNPEFRNIVAHHAMMKARPSAAA